MITHSNRAELAIYKWDENDWFCEWLKTEAYET